MPKSERRLGIKHHVVYRTLAVAFLFWAANQLWPDLRQATIFNDIAIVLFVLDVFLVIVGWPAASSDESFADAHTGPSRKVSGQDEDVILPLKTPQASSQPENKRVEKETGA